MFDPPGKIGEHFIEQPGQRQRAHPHGIDGQEQKAALGIEQLAAIGDQPRQMLFEPPDFAFGSAPEYPCYAMTKSAITALVRHVALQYGRDGIRANAVCPGVVITDEVRPKLSDQLLADMLKPIPATRLGTVDDIGAMVAMLMSDDSQYVNGQCLSVNGGRILR